MPAIRCRRDAGAAIFRERFAAEPQCGYRRARSRGEPHVRLPCDISNRGGGGRCGSHATLLSLCGVCRRAHVPAGWLAWGFTGPAASSPSRSSGTAATQAIEGLTAPFALLWTGRSRDHADALPSVTVRVRALSWFEIAVSVTSSTVTMVPPPLIPASAPGAPAGFRGHLVAMGRGRRRGPRAVGAAGADGLLHHLQAMRMTGSL